MCRRNFLRTAMYRGQNKCYDTICCSFERREENWSDETALDYKLLNNLQAQEFMKMLSTHPIFMMFDRGVILEPVRKPFYIDMNYYGLCQHYGFKTGVIDFTTDIDVAAFFAATKYCGDDNYTLYESAENSYGVIYTSQIIPNITFKGLGFSTIGQQLYPRTAAQKGILWNEGVSRIAVDACVEKHLFRHDSVSDSYFYNKMNKGQLLFPNDTLAPLAQGILHDTKISGEVFATNLFTNQQALNINLDRLARCGASVDWNMNRVFTPDLLKEFYCDLKNGIWEQFCDKVYFGGEKGCLLKESLLRLPENPYYRHFFRLDDWHNYQRTMCQNQDSAKRNATRKIN